MSAAAISTHDLRVTYGETVALEGVELEIAPGRIHGLVGMNGSGKSTLFKAVMGLVRPAAGRIEVFGSPPAAARRRGRIAYTPQSEEIDWAFPISVEDVVLTGRYGQMGITRRARAADRRAAREAIARVELESLAERQIGALSGGQRKRAFLARSLAQEADLLLLDEPFAGVDKRSEATITRVLRETVAAGGTVFISTHDLVAIPELCDDVALLNRKVIFHGPPEEALRPENLAPAFGGFVPLSLADERRARTGS